MIQGVLKPMPGYAVHYRAGIEIPKSGLKFVVDERAAKEFDVQEGELVMSPKGYEHMKEANGSLIVIEPLGGMVDSAKLVEELAQLRDENEGLHKHRRFQDEKLVSIAQERDALKARVAELEAAPKPKK